MKLEFGISKEEVLKMRSSRGSQKYLQMIDEFLEGKHDAVKVQTDKDDKVGSIYNSIHMVIKRKKLPLVVLKRQGAIYMMKI